MSVLGEMSTDPRVIKAANALAANMVCMRTYGAALAWAQAEAFAVEAAAWPDAGAIHRRLSDEWRRIAEELADGTFDRAVAIGVGGALFDLPRPASPLLVASVLGIPVEQALGIERRLREVLLPKPLQDWLAEPKGRRQR